MSLPSMKYVLVTGTNGGLGLGICTRLLDDFLKSTPASASLTLIFTTRSTSKGTATLQILQSHLAQNFAPETLRRIHFRAENVELTNIRSICAAARRLLSSDIPYINAVIMNAGIGGWSGLHWPMAIRDVMLNMVTNTTWPKFKAGIAGLITEKQFGEGTLGAEEYEPPLGQVFCANVFGHYLLGHWLMPLLCACDEAEPAKVIWVSSIEAQKQYFSEDDLMGIRTTTAYESSKQLTDLLALTYNKEATTQSVKDYIAEDNAIMRVENGRSRRSIPVMHVAHPGICNTSIVALYWVMEFIWGLTVYLPRLIGSPWTTIHPYLAAMSFTWLVLTPERDLEVLEKSYGEGKGRVKWGTAVTRLGYGSVKPTEVQDWGLNGSGDAFTDTWWGGRFGRVPGAIDAKTEDVQNFVALGARVWREMEQLRREWEARLAKFDSAAHDGKA